MAQFEDMRLPAGAREALVDAPNFLREIVEATLNRLLDTEITEHLQARCVRALGGAYGVPQWVPLAAAQDPRRHAHARRADRSRGQLQDRAVRALPAQRESAGGGLDGAGGLWPTWRA